MGKISIDYGGMSTVERNARKAASRCEKYSGQITKRVTSKLSGLNGGSSDNTSQADYFAKRKIKDLEAKQRNYESYAEKVKSARDYAKEKDRTVSQYIKTESQNFRKQNNMNVNAVVEFFAWMSTTILNKTEFGRWISQKFREASAWVGDKVRDFKRWYELDGGKYIVKTVLAVIGTVIAVVVLVCVAWPAVVAAFGAIASAVAAGTAISGAMLWTAITAAAGFVTAVMSCVDSVTKIFTNAYAATQNEDDPGWANRYGKMGSFSDYLRKQLFSSSFMNRLSNITADVYDFVGIVASAINIADLARSGINFAKQIKEQGTSRFFNRIHFKTKDGKVTWGTFKYGIKRIVQNVGITKEHVTNTNISRLTSYFKMQNIAKTLQTFEKVYGGINKAFKTYDNVYEKGGWKTAWDSGIEKIRGKTILWDYGHQIHDLYDKYTGWKGNTATPAAAGGGFS